MTKHSKSPKENKTKAKCTDNTDQIISIERLSINKNKEDRLVSATLRISKRNYIGKIEQFTAEIEANKKIMDEVKEFKTASKKLENGDKTKLLRTEIDRLSKKYILYGPYKKCLRAIMTAKHPSKDLIVEFETLEDDKDHFYLKINNNVTTTDIPKVYAEIVELLNESPNRTTNVVGDQNETLLEAIKLRSERRTYKEIAELFNDMNYVPTYGIRDKRGGEVYAYTDIQQMFHEYKQKKLRYKR